MDNEQGTLSPLDLAARTAAVAAIREHISGAKGTAGLAVDNATDDYLLIIDALSKCKTPTIDPIFHFIFLATTDAAVAGMFSKKLRQAAEAVAKGG
jgi:hypothetical protein